MTLTLSISITISWVTSKTTWLLIIAMSSAVRVYNIVPKQDFYGQNSFIKNNINTNLLIKKIIILFINIYNNL